MQEDRLSQIGTLWSVVRRAHGADDQSARAAQQQLLERYGPAVRRYLHGALRDRTAADEMYQEFSLRFLRGDYAQADPTRGRFRNFLRTILVRLVIEYHRQQRRDKLVQVDLPEAEDVRDEQARAFTHVWRDELLRRSWDALADMERRTGKPLHTVMNQRVAHPELSSAELADILATTLNKTISTANLRVMLHRARHEFAKLLLAEVSNTLDLSGRAELEEELIELNLHKYCQPLLS